MTYSLKEAAAWNFPSLICASVIIKKCGDDMYAKYGLSHWKNSFIKTFLIVFYKSLNHKVYTLSNESGITVATFQTKRCGDSLHFSKLAVLPEMSSNGIGSYCLQIIADLAKRSGLKYLRCEVYNQSRRAYDFYINNGFTEISEISTFKYQEAVLQKKI